MDFLLLVPPNGYGKANYQLHKQYRGFFFLLRVLSICVTLLFHSVPFISAHLVSFFFLRRNAME